MKLLYRLIVFVFAWWNISAAATGQQQRQTWKLFAARDLAAIRQCLLTNHPTYVTATHGPDAWINKGYAQAQAVLENVTSLARYEALIRYYVNGFHGLHLSLEPSVQPSIVHWPGFLVTYHNGALTVSCRRKNHTEHLPPLGAHLVTCNNRSIASIMNKNIFMFYGNSTVEADWHLYAPYLFIDRQHPWHETIRTCTFEHNGKLLPFELTYEKVSYARIQQQIAALIEPQNRLAIEKFAAEAIWISLPTLWPTTPQEQSSLKKVIDECEKYRAAHIIVLDLRGNRGGDIRFGYELLEKLFGKSTLAQLLATGSNTLNTVCTSPANINQYEQHVADMHKNFGQASNHYYEFQQFVKALQQTAQAGKKAMTFTTPTISPDAYQLIEQSIVQGSVYVLTDYAVQSAAYRLTEALRAIKGVVHVGLQTNVPTNATSINRQQLPSRLGWLNFPMMINQTSDTQASEPLTPDYCFEGDITDTQAVQKWLLTLHASLHHEQAP